MTEHMRPPENIYIAPSTMRGGRYGRGVFARETIPAGILIERCPVIALHDPKDRARLRKTELVNYYFLWGEKRNRVALCLGWGSIYNHSFEPNARYEKSMQESCMDFYAIKEIKKGEEIIVNYNGTPTDTRPLRIPGIPAEAGGMKKTRMPRVVEGILRRAQLVKAWVAKKS